MAEVVGTVFTSLQIAQAGFSLVQTLHEFTRDAKSARKDIAAVAEDVRLTSVVLQHLHEEILDNEKLYNSTAVKDFEAILGDCHRSFDTIRLALESLRKPSAGGNAKSISDAVSFTSKVRWGFIEKKKIAVHRADLERQKTALLLMLNVFLLGEKMSRNAGPKGKDFVIEKLAIEQLVKAKNEAVQKYEKLVLTLQINAHQTPPTPSIDLPGSLLDSGLSAKTLKQRREDKVVKALKSAPSSISSITATPSSDDHVGGAANLIKKTSSTSLVANEEHHRHEILKAHLLGLTDVLAQVHHKIDTMASRNHIPPIDTIQQSYSVQRRAIQAATLPTLAAELGRRLYWQGANELVLKGNADGLPRHRLVKVEGNVYSLYDYSSRASRTLRYFYLPNVRDGARTPSPPAPLPLELPAQQGEPVDPNSGQYSGENSSNGQYESDLVSLLPAYPHANERKSDTVQYEQSSTSSTPSYVSRYSRLPSAPPKPLEGSAAPGSVAPTSYGATAPYVEGGRTYMSTPDIAYGTHEPRPASPALQQGSTAATPYSPPDLYHYATATVGEEAEFTHTVDTAHQSSRSRPPPPPLPMRRSAVPNYYPPPTQTTQPNSEGINKPEGNSSASGYSRPYQYATYQHTAPQSPYYQASASQARPSKNDDYAHTPQPYNPSSYSEADDYTPISQTYDPSLYSSTDGYASTAYSPMPPSRTDEVTLPPNHVPPMPPALPARPAMQPSRYSGKESDDQNAYFDEIEAILAGEPVPPRGRQNKPPTGSASASASASATLPLVNNDDNNDSDDDDDDGLFALPAPRTSDNNNNNNNNNNPPATRSRPTLSLRPTTAAIGASGSRRTTFGNRDEDARKFSWSAGTSRPASPMSWGRAAVSSLQGFDSVAFEEGDGMGECFDGKEGGDSLDDEDEEYEEEDEEDGSGLEAADALLRKWMNVNVNVNV